MKLKTTLALLLLLVLSTSVFGGWTRFTGKVKFTNLPKAEWLCQGSWDQKWMCSNPAATTAVILLISRESVIVIVFDNERFPNSPYIVRSDADHISAMYEIKRILKRLKFPGRMPSLKK